MKKLLTILCLVLLSSCTQEVPIETPTEVTPQSPEVVTGPFLIRDGVTYDQNTNEPVTGFIETYNSRQGREKRNYIDGKWDGLRYHLATNEPVTGIVESFHMPPPFHQLKERGNWRNGKREGLDERFHINGQLKSRRNYIDGELNGLEENFYKSGQLFYRENYIDGELNGLHEKFYVNGQLRQRANYIDGELNGLQEYFDEDGNLRYTDTYENGEQVE